MRYLIFKLGAFGDLSYILPVLEQIRQTDPIAEITWIVGRSYAPLLQTHPALKKVIPVHESIFFRGSGLQRVQEIYRLWRSLEQRYDQIWIGYRTPLPFLLLRILTRGPIYQLVRKTSAILRHFRFEVVVPPLSLHERHAFEQLAHPALHLQSNHKRAPSTKADPRWLQQLPVHLSTPKKPYIIVHIGGGLNSKTEFDLKKWPHWDVFLNQLVKRTPSPLLLVGSGEEEAEAAQLVSERIHSLVGQTTLPELLRLIQSAQCVIGVDSGPLHWADYFGVPTLGLYGPTSPLSWGLLGQTSRTLSHPEPCSPCYRDDGHFPHCPFQKKCMSHLTPEWVLAQLEQLIPTLFNL